MSEWVVVLRSVGIQHHNSGREHKVFMFIQSGDDAGGKRKNKKQTIENRKPLVALYDMPEIQWTYFIPRPTRGPMHHMT